MPDSNNKSLTVVECAAKFNVGPDDLKSTIIRLGMRRHVPAAMEVDVEMQRRLGEHYAKRKTQTGGAAPRNRKMGKIDVTERKQRERGPLNRPSLADLRARKSGGKAAPAAPPAPSAASAPAAKPVAAAAPEVRQTKTVKIAKAGAAKAAPAPVESSAPAATATAPAPETAVKTAAKTADKTAAEKPTAKAAPPPVAAKPARKSARAAPPAQPAGKAAAGAGKKPVAAPKPVASAPAPAQEAAPAPAAEPVPVNPRLQAMEALMAKQGAHQAQVAQKKEDIERAAREKKEKRAAPAAAKGAVKGAVKGVAKGGQEKIKLTQAALDARQKKRKKGMTRSEAREKTAETRHAFTKPTAPVVREVAIPEFISVEKLAGETALKSSVIIRKLMDLGMAVTANELLDKETAWIIVEELGHTPIDAPDDDREKELLRRDDDAAPRAPRAPVVTVMGHVDHGKTSLLDYIRKTRVAPGEAGGITQHIGAYSAQTPAGEVTFLDTPGHELFSQMRARGAKITDMVVLVVAADDGVKPQTIEAINHAKAAGVPMLVAANKIDRPDADLEKVKRELAAQEVLPEDWGGDAMILPVSAQTGEGVDKLLEALAMQTELLELSAPAEGPATAVVIEARVDKGRGIVATLVVTSGKLRRGDSFLCGTGSGRVRAMWNAQTPALQAAVPSMPVEMQGLSSIPEAGAELIVVEDERAAREVAAARQDKSRLAKMATRRRAGAAAALAGAAAGDVSALLDAAGAADEWKELNVIVKTDVEGSREALAAALSDIGGKKAGARVIHSAVGAVTESDIYLAQTGGGLIVAFNVRPDSRARKLAESRGVKIVTGSVVYELVEKVREAVLGLLSPIIEEKVVGTARVQEVFGISKVGNIAGCRVEEGIVRAKAPARLTRDGVSVFEGVVASLFHFKDQVAEVRAGSECGIGISRFNDIKAGDVIEILERTETAPEM